MIEQLYTSSANTRRVVRVTRAFVWRAARQMYYIGRVVARLYGEGGSK